MVRLTVYWASVAPSDPPGGFNARDPSSPGYDWSGVDREVRYLSDAGFKILIQISAAPSWAEGANKPSSASSGSWEPNAADFGQFVSAIATRYDGSYADLPRVADWQAWNEPNLSEYLSPQWVRQTSSRNWVAESPIIYRNLENALFSAVKAVSAGNYVVAVGTAPYGDPAPGGQRIQPVTFDQDLFCLDSTNHATGGCPGPTYLDAIDNHPYVSGLCCLPPTWHAGLAADTSVADMYKIVNVLKAAELADTAAPAGTKGVWASEIGWNTGPPNPDTHAASPPGQVALWGEQALYVLWSQGVNNVLWFQLADEPENSGGWDDTYTEGLYYAGGVAKPTVQAFRFPFVTNRRTKRRIEAWGRAPKTGTVWIQRKTQGRWTSIARLRTKATQVFEAPIPLTGGGTFRAVIGGVYSLPWFQSA